jgi:poly-beta-1,6-N-acetyl-D-glucosamine N-deacetylase
VLRRKLRSFIGSLIGGTAVSAVLLGLMVVFIQQTIPERTEPNPPPAVQLSAAERDRATSFAAFDAAIPALVYRDVSATRERAVTPRELAQHLAILREAGFTSVSLADVRRFLAGEPVRLPPRPILITFDNARSSQFTDVHMILHEYGFHAVTFVPTGQLAEKTPAYHLTRQELRQLVGSWWEMGSQSDSGNRSVSTGSPAEGPWLTTLEAYPDGNRETFEHWRTRVTTDLDDSLRTIQLFSPSSPDAFAYPVPLSTIQTDEMRRALETAVGDRFDLAFTSGGQPNTVINRSSDPLLLPRTEVRTGTTPMRLLDEIDRAIPRGPAADPTGWRLRDAGGTCSVRTAEVHLSGPGYARCVSELNGRGWRDYTLRTRVRGLASSTTALIGLRDDGRTRVEVALSQYRVILRELRSDGTWTVLDTTEYRGGLSRDYAKITVEVHDRSVTVTIGQRHLGGTLSPDIAFGTVSFGTTGSTKPGVTFDRIQVSALASPAPAIPNSP